MDGAITVAKTGGSITIAASSASIPIPTDSAGNIPVFCRLAATGQCCVKVGIGAATATTNDLLVQNADAVILRTLGFTHVAAISATGSPSGFLQISPLEDAR